MEAAVCEPSVSEPMEQAVWKMPISEPAVFETLASEPARYELPVFEPMKEADLRDESVAAVLAVLKVMETAVSALEETWKTRHAERDEYDVQLDNWKSEMNANCGQAKMEVLNAMAEALQYQQSEMDVEYDKYRQSEMDVEYDNYRQSEMDVEYENYRQSGMGVVYRGERQSNMDVALGNSIQSKRNKQRARKRRLKLVGTDAGVLEGVDL